MTLQPVHEGLGLLRERHTVLLYHTECLVNVLLDVRIWIARGDDTLWFHRQWFPSLEPYCEMLTLSESRSASRRADSDRQ